MSLLLYKYKSYGIQLLIPFLVMADTCVRVYYDRNRNPILGEALNIRVLYTLGLETIY